MYSKKEVIDMKIIVSLVKLGVLLAVLAVISLFFFDFNVSKVPDEILDGSAVTYAEPETEKPEESMIEEQEGKNSSNEKESGQNKILVVEATYVPNESKPQDTVEHEPVEAKEDAAPTEQSDFAENTLAQNERNNIEDTELTETFRLDCRSASGANGFKSMLEKKGCSFNVDIENCPDGDKRITFKYNSDDDLDQKLDEIKKITGLEYKESGG